MSAKPSACREQIQVFRVVPWKPHGALVARTTLFPKETSKSFLVLSFLGPLKVQCESDISKDIDPALRQLFCEFCCVALDGGRHRENNNEGTHFPPPFAFVLCNHQEKIFCSEWPFCQHWPCPPLPRSLGWPRRENLGALLLDYGNLLDLDF